ncbi:MAG: 1-deoxy-D-xylulose-5-phosphate synthase [Planctomycetota bacterium]
MSAGRTIRGQGVEQMNQRLDRLSGPAELRRMNDAELTGLAGEIRERIKAVVCRHGGHLASNLGVVELTLALHRVFDFSSDRLLWDVGHQAYPHKLVTGRAAAFTTNRQRGGLSGFPDPRENPYDVAKVGHSSTAISTAVGIAEAYRRQSVKRKVVAVIGDGALTGGMSFEGLINAGELNSPMLVILNDNGSFIDAPVGALHKYLDRVRSGRLYTHTRDRILGVLRRMPWGESMERLAEHLELAANKLVSPGFIFEDLGLRYFGPVDGHDRVEVERMLRNTMQLDGPILLHVHTRKGGGWEPSVRDPGAFHGPKGFDLETGVFHPSPRDQRPTYSAIFGQTVLELAQEDDELVAVTAAMLSGVGLRPMAERYPDRVYDVGICEQHSFGFVQGLAIAGMRPVLAHYSTFAQRGFDQLFQELVLQRGLGAICVLDRAGLVGEDGETHQGIYDIAWARSLPGVVLMSPKDGDELAEMLRWCHRERQRMHPVPAAFIIRYPRESVPERHWGLDRPQAIAFGRAEVIQRGRGLMIWVYGPQLERVVDAVSEIGEDASAVTIVNARFAKPFDAALLCELAATHDRLLTVEDHALMGGFGSIALEAVGDCGLELHCERAGVRDELVPHASRSEQLAEQGLDVDGLARRIARLLKREEATIPFRTSATKTGNDAAQR